MERTQLSRYCNFGVWGLITASASLVCWYLPFSPGLFLGGILALPAASLLLIVLAGILGSRWWLVALLAPLFLLVMAPQHEQVTRVGLQGNAVDGVSFKFSGTFTVGVVEVDRYSADLQNPDDRRFATWRIEPADAKSALRGAWEVNSIRYGVVPAGYVQVLPRSGAPASLQSGTTYRIHADFCGGFFKIVDHKPRWVPTPSDAPCFAKPVNGEWRRIACR